MSDELKFLDKALDDATAASIEAEEREMRIALRAMCLTAKQEWPGATYIALDDSDQGDWAVLDQVLNADGEVLADGYDWTDEQYTMHLYSGKSYLLHQFLRDGTEPGHHERNPMQVTLDIEKVLREVKVP